MAHDLGVKSMFIKKIIDYDEEAQEADVIISDGENDLMCYAQPFNIKDRNKPFNLFAMLDSDVVRSYAQNCLIQKIDDGYYSYRICGRLIDVKEPMVSVVKVFNIIMEVGGPIPKDIIENEYIEFDVMRIDYFIKE